MTAEERGGTGPPERPEPGGAGGWDEALVTIKVRAGGPLKVTGPVRLVDHEGRPLRVRGDDLVLCRCGRSADKPFCDGSHRRPPGIDATGDDQGPASSSA